MRTAPAVLTLSLFLLDRAVKSFIFIRWQEGESRAILPSVFHLTRVNNTGAAFGILKDATPFLALISVVCAAVLSWILFIRPQSSRLKSTAFALVLAGALGNLYDRLCYGYVLDYFDFRIWPVFNIADACITLGAFLLALTVMTGRRL